MIALWVALGVVVRCRDVEQRTGSNEVLGASAVGKKAVVTDAVEA